MLPERLISHFYFGTRPLFMNNRKWLCHECRQYHHLCGDWRTLVESVGLLVIKYKERSVRIEMFL
jgi:hypothetical protein